MEDYKFLFKVVLIGNAGVGKTCLVRRFTQGLFPPGQGATIGVDFMIKNVEVDGEKVKLQIWDTAGQERFRSITQSYYRSAHALILVYDVSCQPTFDCLPDWLREIEQYASSKVLRVLVGNKIDRDDREIPRHIGEEFAQQQDMYFLETSAKEADNVETLFMEIATRLTHEAKTTEVSHYINNGLLPGRDHIPPVKKNVILNSLYLEPCSPDIDTLKAQTVKTESFPYYTNRIIAGKVGKLYKLWCVTNMFQ